MAAPAVELRSDKTTAQLKVTEGQLDIQLPLTLTGWSLVEMFEEYGDRPVIVRSADGDPFTAEVTDVDELRYVVTVELS